MTPWDRKSKSRINSRTFSRPICPYFLSVCFCPPQDKVGQNCCQYKASLDLPLIDLFFNLLSVCFLSTWRKSLSELLSIQGFARPPSLPARPYPVLALNITLTRNFVGIVNIRLSLIFFSLHRFYLFHLLTVLSVIIHLRPNLSELSMQGFAVSPSRYSVFLSFILLSSLYLSLSTSRQMVSELSTKGFAGSSLAL